MDAKWIAALGHGLGRQVQVETHVMTISTSSRQSPKIYQRGTDDPSNIRRSRV